MGRATSPKTTELLTIVTEELAGIPRGDFYQNMYRALYEQSRLNGLGRRAHIVGTASAAHEIAFRSVRERRPDFAPVLLS